MDAAKPERDAVVPTVTFDDMLQAWAENPGTLLGIGWQALARQQPILAEELLARLNRSQSSDVLTRTQAMDMVLFVYASIRSALERLSSESMAANDYDGDGESGQLLDVPPDGR